MEKQNLIESLEKTIQRLTEGFNPEDYSLQVTSDGKQVYDLKSGKVVAEVKEDGSYEYYDNYKKYFEESVKEDKKVLNEAPATISSTKIISISELNRLLGVELETLSLTDNKWNSLFEQALQKKNRNDKLFILTIDNAFDETGAPMFEGGAKGFIQLKSDEVKSTGGKLFHKDRIEPESIKVVQAQEEATQFSEADIDKLIRLIKPLKLKKGYILNKKQLSSASAGGTMNYGQALFDYYAASVIVNPTGKLQSEERCKEIIKKMAKFKNALRETIRIEYDNEIVGNPVLRFLSEAVKNGIKLENIEEQTIIAWGDLINNRVFVPEELSKSFATHLTSYMVFNKDIRKFESEEVSRIINWNSRLINKNSEYIKNPYLLSAKLDSKQKNYLSKNMIFITSDKDLIRHNLEKPADADYEYKNFNEVKLIDCVNLPMRDFEIIRELYESITEDKSSNEEESEDTYKKPYLLHLNNEFKIISADVSITEDFIVEGGDLFFSFKKNNFKPNDYIEIAYLTAEEKQEGHILSKQNRMLSKFLEERASSDAATKILANVEKTKEGIKVKKGFDILLTDVECSKEKNVYSIYNLNVKIGSTGKTELEKEEPAKEVEPAKEETPVTKEAFNKVKYDELVSKIRPRSVTPEDKEAYKAYVKSLKDDDLKNIYNFSGETENSRVGKELFPILKERGIIK